MLEVIVGYIRKIGCSQTPKESFSYSSLLSGNISESIRRILKDLKTTTRSRLTRSSIKAKDHVPLESRTGVVNVQQHNYVGKLKDLSHII